MAEREQTTPEEALFNGMTVRNITSGNVFTCYSAGDLWCVVPHPDNTPLIQPGTFKRQELKDYVRGCVEVVSSGSTPIKRRRPMENNPGWWRRLGCRIRGWFCLPETRVPVERKPEPTPAPPPGTKRADGKPVSRIPYPYIDPEKEKAATLSEIRNGLIAPADGIEKLIALNQIKYGSTLFYLAGGIPIPLRDNVHGKVGDTVYTLDRRTGNVIEIGPIQVIAMLCGHNSVDWWLSTEPPLGAYASDCYGTRENAEAARDCAA